MFVLQRKHNKSKFSKLRQQVEHLIPNIKNGEYFVYKLICPIDKEIKWVGLTQDLFHRLYAHIYNKNLNFDKQYWINKLKYQKTVPNFDLLGRFMSKEQGLEFEKEMILKHRKTIFNKINQMDISLYELKYPPNQFKANKQTP